MQPAHADSDTLQAYRKSAGDEPLPGYVLIEPLGRGGFGEVWKCEAPGGLHKAIKFVPGANSEDGESTAQFQQEFDAFLHIKTIRHPFLLTLERVEQVGGDLVMVMELADRQMRDRYDECRAEGHAGIPREELIGYLGEAAEALDVINSNYNLQHLDVKPANLFITMGHVKVGDYGLVCRLDGGADQARGLTPKYVAPEVLRGGVDARSDQYSLALVYQEMLTGAFPYSGRTPQQMMLAHVSANPDLSPLPECDRGPVAKALAKKPEERFGSCQEFIHALLAAGYAAHASSPAAAGSRSGVMPFHYRPIETTPGPAERTGRHVAPSSGTVPLSKRGSGESTRQLTNQTLPPLTTPGRSMPPLTTQARWPAPPTAAQAPPPKTPAKPGPLTQYEDELPLADSTPLRMVKVNPIRTVVPVGRLHGHELPDAATSARDFAAAVVLSCAAGNYVPAIPGDIGRLSDGSYICQFPSTVPESFAPLKLAVVRDAWSMTLESPEPGRLVFRKSASGGLWSALSGKKAGLELIVKLPAAGKAIGEVTVLGSLYGTPDRTFLQASQTALPKIIEDIRRELGNVSDRRKSPRIVADLKLIVHPLHSDGTVESAVVGRCKDLSATGIAFSLPGPVKVRYAYIEFDGVVPVAGMAILVKLIRSQPITPNGEHLVAGPFRLEL